MTLGSLITMMTLPVQEYRFYNSVGSLGAAFLNSLKVLIYEGFYWRMNKTSMGGGIKKGGSNIKLGDR